MCAEPTRYGLGFRSVFLARLYLPDSRCEGKGGRTWWWVLQSVGCKYLKKHYHRLFRNTRTKCELREKNYGMGLWGLAGGSDGIRSFPAGRWSENLPHRIELLHRVAQGKRTGCRIGSRRAGRALSRSSGKFEMRIRRDDSTVSTTTLVPASISRMSSASMSWAARRLSASCAASGSSRRKASARSSAFR